MIHPQKRIPLPWKFLTAFALISLIYYGVFYYINQTISTVIDPSVSMSLFARHFIVLFMLGSGLSGLIIALLYRDIMGFLSTVSRQISVGIQRKRMASSMPEWQSRDIFQTISHSFNQLATLFTQFDHLKSARIVMEINSIKCLMNSISEGIIFVNPDKIVSHINHKAEELFRLVPGEIIGTTLSRHMNHPAITEHLNTALSNDQNITDVIIQLRETETVLLTILPIKDPRGSVVRGIILLKKIPAADETPA
jgi:PAS domain-containing protein